MVSNFLDNIDGIHFSQSNSAKYAMNPLNISHIVSLDLDEKLAQIFDRSFTFLGLSKSLKTLFVDISGMIGGLHTA